MKEHRSNSLIFDRSAAAAAAFRGETAGILEKSHKVKKNWKMREHGVKK